MRKDVKIGLAIAGVLVVLLIVYAIIPHNKDKSVAQNPDAGGGQVEVGTTGAPPETETPSTTETPTIPKKDPFGTGETPTSPTTKGGVDINHPNDTPVASDSGSGSSAGTNWAQIMETGQLPKAEKGAGAPPLYTTAPNPTGNNRSGSSAKPGDTHPPTDANNADAPKGTERPLYGSDSPSRRTGGSSTDSPIVPMTPAGTSGSGERSHVIQKGETLSAIAEVAYGSSKYYTLIKKANPDLDDRHLKVGASIKIPERAESPSTPVASRTNGTGGSSNAPSLAAVEKSAGSAATSVNSSTEYKVQSGDTLYGIAKKLYGNGSRMHKLHDLNKATLGSDPDSLKIGMVLKLPEPPTVATSLR